MVSSVVMSVFDSVRCKRVTVMMILFHVGASQKSSIELTFNAFDAEAIIY